MHPANTSLKEDFMTKYASYRYVGDDNPYGLKNGKRYNLAVYSMNWFQRLLSRYPVGWSVIAYRPFERNTCLMPYASMHDFESNWCKVLVKQTANKPLIPAH